MAKRRKKVARSVAVNVRMNPAEHDALVGIADAKGVSCSDVVRMLVREEMMRLQGLKEGGSLLKGARL